MSWTPQASSEEAQTKVWEEVRKSTEEDDYRYGDLLLGWGWRSRKQVLVWFCLAFFFLCAEDRAQGLIRARQLFCHFAAPLPPLRQILKEQESWTW
jgi:hypothetical protein